MRTYVVILAGQLLLTPQKIDLFKLYRSNSSMILWQVESCEPLIERGSISSTAYTFINSCTASYVAF